LGGLIETPNTNKLAANGLTYTNWHTTAMCSPTRSSLLNGRNRLPRNSPGVQRERTPGVTLTMLFSRE
jgi:arylsulfatase